MIDDIAGIVGNESITVLIKTYVVHLVSHGAAVDLNTDDTDKSAAEINRYIVRNHANVKIVGHIRRQPDRAAGIFRHGKPYKFISISCVVKCNIRHFVFPETSSVKIGVPEPLYIFGNLRINTVVIGQSAVGNTHRPFEKSAHSPQMSLKFPVFK